MVKAVVGHNEGLNSSCAFPFSIISPEEYFKDVTISEVGAVVSGLALSY